MSTPTGKYTVSAASVPPPAPIFDALDHMENPFYQHVFDAAPYLLEPIAGANTDLEYAAKFIYSYNGSKATFNSYRREVERLLHWAWRVRHCSILELKRHDIEEFVLFCQKPEKDWIGTIQATRFTVRQGLRQPNEKWRPFTATIPKTETQRGKKAKVADYELSQTALKALFAILSSFYNFLIQEEVTEANPVALIRQKSKFITTQTRREIRRISNLQWEYLIEQVDEMALDEPDLHERTRFVMHCLLCMYLRISEVVADDRSTPMMSHFYRDSDGHWWFDVVGKGNKARSIAVSDAMIEALKRFRLFLGLNPLPAPGETTPLLPKLRGKGGMRSTAWVRAIIQKLFDLTHDRMAADGLSSDALELKAATVHWLRHTGISEDVKFRPIEHVRDDAGHSSAMTTDKYIDAERRARHASARNKPAVPD